MSKITKRPKDPWYKKWSALSEIEKAAEKWNRKGQPRVFWPTKLAKTFDRHDDNCIAFLELMKKQSTENLQKLETKIDETIHETGKIAS